MGRFGWFFEVADVYSAAYIVGRDWSVSGGVGGHMDVHIFYCKMLLFKIHAGGVWERDSSLPRKKIISIKRTTICAVAYFS